jgi:hypothetical protein
MVEKVKMLIVADSREMLTVTYKRLKVAMAAMAVMEVMAVMGVH